MVVSKFEASFLKTVFILATIEGLAWTVLSLICIILYYNPHDISAPKGYSDTLTTYLYIRYIKGFPVSKANDLMVVRPKDFVAFMWIYFFGSSLWVALSVYLPNALRHKRQHLPMIMSIWSVLVFLISLLDFVLMCLLARDYKACEDKPGNSYCFLLNGIGLALAARGFLLWILNVVMAVIILFIGIKLYKQIQITKSIRIPRAHVPNEINNWSRSPNHHSDLPNFPPGLVAQQSLNDMNELSNPNHLHSQGQLSFPPPNQPIAQRGEHLPSPYNQRVSRPMPGDRLNMQRIGY